MTRKTHVRVGFIPVAMVYTFLPLIVPPLIIAFVLSVIASTLPDIDLLLGIRHRYLTHNLCFAFLTSVPLYIFLGIGCSLIWFVACGSHLFLDSLTEMGVPLLYPFSKKMYGCRKLKTGGKLDNWIVLYGIFFAVGIVLSGVEQLIYRII